MRPAQAGSRAIPVAGHGAAIREARVAQGTGPPSGTDAATAAAVILSPFVVNELVVEKPLLRLLIHCNFGLGIGYLYRLCAVRGSVPADKAEWDRARVAWPVDLTNRTIPKSSAGRLGKRKAGGRYAADLVLQLPARGPVSSHSIFLYRV
jgi:hypothetical protein